jgi:hypothetical protein
MLQPCRTLEGRMDWRQTHTGPLMYSEAQFGWAKAFVFRQWCAWAVQREAPAPLDLSGACKYGSLFMCRVYGGSIQGHYQHQYNHINGQRVDLSYDAADVAGMAQPYLHEPLYFDIPEGQRALAGCLPRVDHWVSLYLAEDRARQALTPESNPTATPPA